MGLSVVALCSYKHPTPIEDFISRINDWTVSEKHPTSRLELIDGELYKVFWDKLHKDYTRVNEATKAHAHQDYNRMHWNLSQHSWQMTRFLEIFDYITRKHKCEYVTELCKRIVDEVERQKETFRINKLKEAARLKAEKEAKENGL